MTKNKKDRPSLRIIGENAVGSIHASDRAKVEVSQSSVRKTNDPNSEQLFKLLEEKIEARPENPNVDKEEIQEQVNQIKAEAAKGEQANLNKPELWIGNLSGRAPESASENEEKAAQTSDPGVEPARSSQPELVPRFHG